MAITMNSFHNNIALQLEDYACREFGDSGRPLGKWYDADSIENGNFAKCMITLLERKYGNDCPSEVSYFIRECRQYMGARADQIGYDTAKSLFDEFCCFYDVSGK
ncbi:hypothetical protein [Eubacterium sp. F2]|uniref:hypothetical protein n=1 Tax=Eubacterium sp. F2 TaxID=3381348 RepID=UPI003907F001